MDPVHSRPRVVTARKLVLGIVLAGAAVAGTVHGPSTASAVVWAPPQASGPPVIASVSQPVVLPNRLVVISGTNLQGATDVTAGDESLVFTYGNIARTRIFARIPSDYTGGDIVVTTPLGSASVPVRPFRVDSVSPDHAGPGDTLTLTGQGFTAITDIWSYNPDSPAFPTDPSQVETTISFQLAALPFQDPLNGVAGAGSDTQLTLTVPANAVDGAPFYADIPGSSLQIGTFH